LPLFKKTSTTTLLAAAGSTYVGQVGTRPIRKTGGFLSKQTCTRGEVQIEKLRIVFLSGPIKTYAVSANAYLDRNLSKDLFIYDQTSDTDPLKKGV
jgi:hypothetical protein